MFPWSQCVQGVAENRLDLDTSVRRCPFREGLWSRLVNSLPEIAKDVPKLGYNGRPRTAPASAFRRQE